VLADRDHLLIVMDNLIENAIKFTPEGGEVRVSVSASDTRVRLEVRDTGVGMERGHISRAFNRFFKIDPAGAGNAGGLGLGLYVCRMIIKRHDGRIGAESEPGAGSVFFFELPKESLSRQNTIPGLEV